MKKLQIVLLALSLAGWMRAQDSTDFPQLPPSRSQFGLQLSDYAVGVIGADFGYRIKNQHLLGIYLGGAEQIGFEDLQTFEELDYGLHIRPYHKMYIGASSRDNFVYLRHGPRFSAYSYTYSTEQWVEIVRDGNTFLERQPVTTKEQSQMLGYDVMAGTEIRFNYFLVDIFGGIGYRSILNKDELFYEETDSSDDYPNISHFDGWRFVVGARVGIYLDDLFSWPEDS